VVVRFSPPQQTTLDDLAALIRNNQVSREAMIHHKMSPAFKAAVSAEIEAEMQAQMTAVERELDVYREKRKRDIDQATMDVRKEEAEKRVVVYEKKRKLEIDADLQTYRVKRACEIDTILVKEKTREPKNTYHSDWFDLPAMIERAGTQNK
jgi:hypothetical protein